MARSIMPERHHGRVVRWLRCRGGDLKRGRGGFDGPGGGLVAQRSGGSIDASSLRLPSFRDDAALSLSERPLFHVETATSLLKRGGTEANLARGVLQREVK
jgi:hypothetical protein